MNRRISMALLAAMLMGIVSGCHYSADGQRLASTGPGLIVSEVEHVANVPVPMNFVLVSNRSRSWSAGDYYYQEYLYQGRAPLEEVIDFYRRHLERRGWQFVGERTPGGPVMMQYTQGSMVLAVQIVQPRQVTSVWIQTRRPATRADMDRHQP